MSAASITDAASQAVIRLSSVRKEYDDVVAVQGLDLEIPGGEVYGLIGPNGAGKTTTIRMASGLLPPTAGHVLIQGVDIHREPERAQQFVGYLSDFFALYEDLKVWEYLDYFATAYRMPRASIPARIDEVIASVGLEVKRDAFIKGLSRGMKQRLGIARAILHYPKVLLLDEPASGLDPKARLDLRNLLRALAAQGTTVLISSHILTELEGFCTSIGIMERGQMLRSGRIEAITSEETPHRTVRFRWMGSLSAEVAGAMQSHPRVSDLTLRDGEAVFHLDGSEQDLAEVLAFLVEHKVLVTAFGEVKQTVEDLYVRLSRNEVM